MRGAPGGAGQALGASRRAIGFRALRALGALLALTLCYPAAAQGAAAPVEDAGRLPPPRGGGDEVGAEPDLPATLNPPVLLRDSPAAYPEPLGDGPGEGEVKLELVIDEEGHVASAEVVQSVQPELDRAALDAALGLRFAPAELDGVPVSAAIGFSYHFVRREPDVAARQEAAGVGGSGATGEIAGRVRARGTREPVIGAALLIGSRTILTDEQGRFRAEVAAGEHTLKVVAPGYRPAVFEEQVEPGQRLEVVYGVEPKRVHPYETVVRGARARTEVARVSLERQELREVPGTMGDPFRVVMLMPGVGSMVSGLSYPVVRGASPASTGFFLDGIRVPVLYHLFLGPAVIHPDFIDGMDFLPGAPPARFGRLIGGVIDGQVRRPRDRVHASAYADLINAGGFLEVPIVASGTSLALAGRYSYTPYLLALAANSARDGQPGAARFVADFWDYQGRIEQRIGSGRLRLLGFGSSDRVGTEADDPMVFASAQKVLFHRLDLRYQGAAGGGELVVGGTLGRDTLGFDAQDPGRGGTLFGLHESSWGLRASWSGPLAGQWKLAAGADLEHRGAEIDLRGNVSVFPMPSVDVDQPLAVATFAGAWSELVWQSRDEKWTLVPGLRFDNYHLVPGIDHPVLEPRMTVRRKLADWLTLKSAAGLYHQAPTTLIQLPVLDMASLRWGLQRALQLDVGAEAQVARGLELSVDAYVNPLLRTLELNPFDPERATSLPRGSPFSRGSIGDLGEVLRGEDYSSHGFAYGLEVMLRHPLGGDWFGWISYALQRSTRYATFTRYNERGEAVARESGYLPYALDQTHILNAVLSWRLGRWTLGVSAHLRTGRPESGVMTSTTMRQGSDRAGRAMWVRASADETERLPLFYRLDLRVARTFVFDTFVLDTYLDVMNVSMNTEVLGNTYSGGVYAGGGPLRKQAEGLPVVLPALGVKATY